MAQLHFSDEILMAFADGELDEAVSASVEQAMAVDPMIARRISEFLRSRRLARSAYSAQAAFDVPPQLLAAVQAQVDRFDAERKHTSPTARKWNFGLALAASLAALAIGTGGYFVGREAHQSPPHDAMAYLSAPEVNSALNETLSGQERDLPFGKFRAISTFRTADGALCREFKLQTPQGASDTVACHSSGWKIAFAVAAAESGAYVPSDGADLMANYLQSAGAGEPLLGTDETEALNESLRQH
ncbi:anti-sigma factor family protein [Microvirga solisilvae]|uniref:anti-sigma factor family protein n=1 Tax=Microvirga solisilvae TaxID=2919498 RepID=UPI001FAEC262|nr:hypothetical protein [Microvirga solisilvae]